MGTSRRQRKKDRCIDRQTEGGKKNEERTGYVTKTGPVCHSMAYIIKALVVLLSMKFIK